MKLYLPPPPNPKTHPIAYTHKKILSEYFISDTPSTSSSNDLKNLLSRISTIGTSKEENLELEISHITRSIHALSALDLLFPSLNKEEDLVMELLFSPIPRTLRNSEEGGEEEEEKVLFIQDLFNLFQNLLEGKEEKEEEVSIQKVDEICQEWIERWEVGGLFSGIWKRKIAQEEKEGKEKEEKEKEGGGERWGKRKREGEQGGREGKGKREVDGREGKREGRLAQRGTEGREGRREARQDKGEGKEGRQHKGEGDGTQEERDGIQGERELVPKDEEWRDLSMLEFVIAGLIQLSPISLVW